MYRSSAHRLFGWIILFRTELHQQSSQEPLINSFQEIFEILFNLFRPTGLSSAPEISIEVVELTCRENNQITVIDRFDNYKYNCDII
ncbi:hypothetical protein BpHYR1_029995 [Brachionus plicatilis]|uniref:Uncharacterized protein n=1 Tax=Brachionus plicatilis TaxID=10195 RepID=A0A3M7QTJ1_BRAPC|nr:hypothetical protein BpHYR1_029995 [Brachionus plicatilis]